VRRYSRRIEYFLDEVGHEDGAVSGDVGQSCYLAVTATVWITAQWLSALSLFNVEPADGWSVVIVVVQFVNVIAAFRCTRAVVGDISVYIRKGSGGDSVSRVLG